MIVGGPTDGDSNRALEGVAVSSGEVLGIGERGKARRYPSGRKMNRCPSRITTLCLPKDGAGNGDQVGRDRPVRFWRRNGGAARIGYLAYVSRRSPHAKNTDGDGIGEVWGYAQVTRKCYVEAKEGEQRKSKRKVVEMDKETKPIKIGKKEKKKIRTAERSARGRADDGRANPRDPSKVVKIGTKLDPS
ncbi:hypothetical protein DH2020_005545 [Rehmannia glutinosa]|uniref:Uncharacterized protein n=1 Tax=Rehmannia glutinosa TaxID=99300 RepID=A0ABR0XGE4_REHGL